MATTSLGIPKFSLTDNADIAAKLNAISDALDALLLTRSFPVVGRRVTRTDGAKYTVVSGTDKLITGYSLSTTNVGDIDYSAGVLTANTGGLYLVSAHTSWPAQSGTSSYARGVGVYVNGARAAGLSGFSNYTALAGEGARSYNTSGLITLDPASSVEVFLTTAGPNEDVLVYDFALARVA